MADRQLNHTHCNPSIGHAGGGTHLNIENATLLIVLQTCVTSQAVIPVHGWMTFRYKVDSWTPLIKTPPPDPPPRP